MEFTRAREGWHSLLFALPNIVDFPIIIQILQRCWIVQARVEQQRNPENMSFLAHKVISSVNIRVNTRFCLAFK